jgi:ribosomal protein S25
MENKANTKQFYNAKDVAERMQISLSMAYKLIRRLNNELIKKGYIVVSGKVSRSYFERRLCETPQEG